MQTQFQSTIDFVNKNAIYEFLDVAEKERYTGQLKEMFDCYVTSDEFAEATQRERSLAVTLFRELEKFLERIDKPIFSPKPMS